MPSAPRSDHIADGDSLMAIGTGSVLPVTVTEGLLHQFKAWVIAGAALPSVGTAVGFRQTISSAQGITPPGAGRWARLLSLPA